MVSGGASPNNREREEVSVPDPTQIEALPQLAVALNLLRRGRSYAELDRAVGGRSKARVLKSSTLSDLVNGKSVSSKDTLVTFLTACGLTESGQQPWLAAWERVATSHLRRPAGAVRVRTADPRLLGVHASIQADPGAEDLPAYVPRDVDADLRTAVTAAQDRGEFVLVKGSSSVGKTRTLFEAVKAVCPDWWLLHPVDAAAVRAFADAPTPRTVVWLDELQRYLSQPGGIPAGAVRGLLAAKLLVVATLWPSEYSPRTALRTPGEDDPYTEDRLLLRLARVFEVPDAFTPAERQRAEDLADDRLIKVALNAADGRVTQMLAAGPQLVRWWEHADVADPRQGYGKAVITAALDARRVGATAPLTRDFLTAAAPAYLTSVQQATAPPDWFEQAIDYATTLLDGATACLTPVAAGMRQIAGWTTADYLYQHARQIRRAEPLPDMTWQALVDYHHSDDTLRLTENAHRRNQLRVAEIFYRQNVDAGSWIAVEGLADVLVEQGRTDELRQLASSGQWIVAQRLAGLLTTQGRTGEAIAVLRQHADKGRWDAVERLADLLAKLGRIDEVIAVLGEHVDNGRWDAGHRLIDLLAELGRTYELRQLARTARWYAVKQLAGHRLAGVLAEQGRTDDLRQLADDGNWVAAQRLADLLTKEGHPDEAIAVVRQHAQAGRSDAVERLADLLAKLERVDEAIAVLRQNANASRRHAGERLADLLVKQDRIDEAIAILRQHADNGDRDAGERLADLLAEQGRIDELRKLAGAGYRTAYERLADLLAEQDRIDELRKLADTGDWIPIQRLADLMAKQGRIDEAIAALRQLPDDGRWIADERLVALLAKQGRTDELRQLADDGDWNAASQLIDLLTEQGRTDELKREVIAGTRGAAARLAALRRPIERG